MHIQSMIPATGPWTAEITDTDGMVSVTPIVAWAVLGLITGKGDSIVPVIVGGDINDITLVPLPDVGHGLKTRLPYKGVDPWVVVSHPDDPPVRPRGHARILQGLREFKDADGTYVKRQMQP